MCVDDTVCGGVAYVHTPCDSLLHTTTCNPHRAGMFWCSVFSGVCAFFQHVPLSSGYLGSAWPCRGFVVLWAAVVNQTLCNAIVCLFEWRARIAYLKQHQGRIQGVHDLDPWLPPVSPRVYSAVVPSFVVVCWPWLSHWT